MSDTGASESTYHLRLQAVTVPVRDLDRSTRFFQSLGFRALPQITRPDGRRFAAVAPRDGVSALLLVEDARNERIGTATGIAFITDDIDARFREWTALGVRFEAEPKSYLPGWQGASFFDPDGNGFRLAELDVITRQLEAERQKVAIRLEADRRAAYELSIAEQIQAGLFPKRHPSMATLDYAGVCIQAQQVGGDYFDFLDAGDSRLGLAVGDVSGKGIGAALLMANLQATVRSQYVSSVSDLPALVKSVNEMFLRNSPGPSYTSLFIGTYDDATRQLQFVNCGHPPPVLLRHDGSVEMLEPTSGVLGMFEQWNGDSRRLQLASGDVLAIYTDGVTEAFGDDEAEFGVSRLVDVLRASHNRPAQEQLQATIAAVREFSRGTPPDDITLLLARCVGGR